MVDGKITPMPTAQDVGALVQESGKWVPQFVGADGGTAITAGAYGMYSRTGNVVTVGFDIIWRSAGTLQGLVCLGGFPFCMGGPTGAARSYFVGYKYKLTFSVDGALFLTSPGDGSTAYIRIQNGNSFSNLDASSLQEGTEIAGTITYLT